MTQTVVNQLGGAKRIGRSAIRVQQHEGRITTNPAIRTEMPHAAVAKLSERFDHYRVKILTSVDAPVEVRVGAMGAFDPVEQEYADPLIDLLSRLAAEAPIYAPCRGRWTS